MMMLRFLGVGDASQVGLGHASAVVELAEGKRLLIDCGPGVLHAFVEHYAALPDAVFVTHCHLDHIADFEKLFIRSWLQEPQRHCAQLFVPVDIVPLLHERVATYPEALAEGGVNFWEAFQLIPVSKRFELEGCEFRVFPARHHGLNSAFSLCAPNRFFYSGDTRPVPEILTREIDHNAVLFHDCSVVGNPSHSGIDDLIREYDSSLLERMYVYHYNHDSEVGAFAKAGLRCVKPGDEFRFD